MILRRLSFAMFVMAGPARSRPNAAGQLHLARKGHASRGAGEVAGMANKRDHDPDVEEGADDAQLPANPGASAMLRKEQSALPVVDFMEAAPAAICAPVQMSLADIARNHPWSEHGSNEFEIAHLPDVSQRVHVGSSRMPENRK
jgi:hypothetical protein